MCTSLLSGYDTSAALSPAILVANDTNSMQLLLRFNVLEQVDNLRFEVSTACVSRVSQKNVYTQTT